MQTHKKRSHIGCSLSTKLTLKNIYLLSKCPIIHCTRPEGTHKPGNQFLKITFLFLILCLHKYSSEIPSQYVPSTFNYNLLQTLTGLNDNPRYLPGISDNNSCFGHQSLFFQLSSDNKRSAALTEHKFSNTVCYDTFYPFLVSILLLSCR